MAAKSTSAARLKCCVIFLVLATGLVSFRVRVSLTAVRNEVRGIGTQRLLRTHTKIWPVDEEVIVEERVGTSGLVKLTGLAELGAKKATTAAQKLTAKQTEKVAALFTKSKIHTITDKAAVLESKQFQQFAKSVAKVYKTNPEAAEMAVASSLAAHYGDEALASMIVAAKKVPNTENIASKLEEALMQNWLSTRQSAEHVFQALNLDNEKTYNVLINPLLNIWVSYATRLKANPFELLLAKMKTELGDKVTASVLGSMKETTSASSIAHKVENELLQSWTREKLTTEAVFKLLKLDNQEKNIFKFSATSSWVSYATKLDPVNADEQMYSILSASYGDKVLFKMLTDSKEPLLGDVVERIENVQLKNWLSEKKTPKEVFGILQLNNQGTKLFESSTMNTWVTYVTKLDAQRADDLMLSALKSNYAEDSEVKLR